MLTRSIHRSFSLRNFQRVACLSPELSSFQETVSDFSQQVIAPLADTTDISDSFPMNLWPQLGEQGLLGITADEAYGGLDLGYQAHCLAMEEISRASGSIALSYAAHSQLCVNQLVKYGTTQQKDNYLTGLISGEIVGALAMSEVGAGSDVVSMKTKAQKVEGGWMLNGGKMWITNGSIADMIVVYAKTNDSKLNFLIY